MRYLLLILGLFIGAGASAQISTTFSLPDVAADNNTEICLPISVINFTGGIEFGFSLLADPGGALTYSRVQNFNPDIPGFSAADVDDVTFVASGLITVRWQHWDADAGETCADAPTTITLPDGAVLFEVCYNVVGGIATQHPVEFFNKPDSDPFDNIDDSAPVIFNKRAQCNMDNDAFPGVDDGSVTIGVSPLELTVRDDDGIYQPGDTYCVDVIAVSGFEALRGYQFGMRFDTAVLRAISVTANTDLEQNTNGGYNLFGGDAFYGTWAPFGDIVATLPDGTTLVTVCFEVVGECGDDTELTIGTIPASTGGVRPVEANGSGTGLTTIPVVTGGIELEIDNCNPAGFDVIVDCPDGDVNFMQTDICISIRAGDDFFEMTDMDYLITFDPDVLQFTGVGQRNPTLFINIGDDFDLAQVGNGIIAFEWESVGSTTPSLNEGELVYELCFTAIGFGGTSPIVIADFMNDIQNSAGPFTAGLNPTNCAITVQQPDGVAIGFPNNVGFSSTQETCFDVEANSFFGVDSFHLYVGYSSVFFEYVDFTASIPGVSASLITPGLFQLTYDDTALTLTDGTSLGSVCMRARTSAAPGDCDRLGLAEFIPSTAFTEESDGNAVTVQSLDGEACVLFPNGFGLIAGDATGFINDQVCVPFSVTRFTDVTSANFTITFDPTLLGYSSINFSGAWTGLNNSNVDNSGANGGLLNINWNTPNPAGIAIATVDTVQVFEVCFDTRNEPECSDIGFLDAADPVTTTAQGPGSIVYGEGSVCLEDRIILLSISTVPASCEDSDDGMIIFETAPRPNNEDVFIQVNNPVRFGNGGSISGLRPGMTTYTLYNFNGTVSLTDSVEIGVNPDSAAVAMAGDDVTLSCGNNSSALINSQGNVGVDYDIFFLQDDGMTRREVEGTVAADGNITGIVSDPGTYILVVTSSAGCTARDTVEVIGQGQPIVEVGDQLTLDCSSEFVTLDGTGSSEGANVTYLWERINGAEVVLATVGNNIMEDVSTPGRYRLTVTFVDLQCSSTAQVIVRNETQTPNSILPTSANLNCDGSPVVLSVGDAEDDVVYTWSRIETPGMVLSGGNTFTTSDLGTIIVSMQNTVTSCTRVDTVEVLESSGIPAIAFPEQVAISCDPDTTVLQPSYTNVDGNTSYLWSTETGRVVITDISLANPRIVLPGTYQVIVSNGACQDSATVVVTDPVLPAAEAGEGGELSCMEDFQLIGSGSSLQGNEVNFQWFFGEAEVAMGAAAAVSVDMPGTYYLQVTDDSTGCVAIDSVVIDMPSGFPQYAVADTVTGLGCEGDMVSVEVEADDPTYTYIWTDASNTEVGDERQTLVGAPGIYTVVITNPASACVATEQVLVIADETDPPFVAFRQNTLEITCEVNPVLLDAEPSSDGSEFLYVWQNITAGETPEEQGNDSLFVRTAGIYRLTITNQATNCSAFRDVEVSDNRVYPEAETVEGMILDCENRETVIGVNILDQPNDFQIQWAGPQGTTGELPSDTNRITVTIGGTYNVLVINPQTSCVTTLPIIVVDLIDSIATLSIMPTDSFDCNNTSITIDASETELNNATADGIVWTSLDGNTVNPPTGSLIVSVNGPGAYELSVTDATGCTVRDTVDVPAALNTPFAQAGDPLEVECGEMPQLDGSASSPPPGGSVLYTWTAGDGGEVMPGSENSAMPFVSGPGTYQLIVTSLTNGCADTSTTTVMLSDQAAAMLPPSFTTCETVTTLEGNLPAGTTGEWTTFNDDGAVVSFDGNVATISELAEGISLVWTLSAGMDCQNYSSDTTRITPEAAPNANDDNLQVGGTNNIGSIDLLENDQRTGPVTVTLLTEPSFGTVLSNLNGEITFEAPVGLTGVTTIDYEVCSNVCEGLCDQATLTIRSDADGADPQVYNAITPNGDGMNETFVFDILNLRPDDFPNNELIIFNRWGDIIYEAKPYNNDWDGTSANGKMVPEGTYYYVLRLNIGEGDIIRGDVTVVR